MGGSSSSSSGAEGIDATSAEPTANGWWAALGLGGKLYAVPCNAERLLIYDPAAGISTVDTRAVATGAGKWRSAVALGGKIYGVPDKAEHMLVYDVATGRVGGIDTKSIAGRGSYKWQDAVALGGKVYGIPHHADKILIYDPGTNKLTGVSTSGVALGQAKWVKGVALGGKLYGVPCNASTLLVYDPSTGKVSGVELKHLVTGVLKWLAAVAYDGKLYAVPCHAECLLVYDPATGKASTVDTSYVAVGPGKWNHCMALGGRIYGIPDHADTVLVYDVPSGAVWGLDVSSICEGPFKWQSAITMGGKIYAPPYNAESILVLDPISEKVEGLDTTSVATGPGKWGAALALNGRLYSVPWDAQPLLSYQPEQTGSGTVLERSEHLPSGLSQEFLEDICAAWLSEWIYWVEDISKPTPVSPLTVGGKAVSFCIHKVYEDPLQGSPARMANVTADLPGFGKVVYMIFKGSSFLADFVANASVAPDFAPFHQNFDDCSTFVHHGAFHSVAQLRVHQWTALLDQLRTAEEGGIQRLVVTGHSLGGQYAMAFLLQVFVEERRKAWTDEPELLKKVRCVSFGSPMCFGAAEGSHVREDLAKYISSRAVNYVNGGDPAPRLWSELNLHDFMRYFVDWLHGQISGFSRRLVDYAVGPGGLAKRVEELLNKPDLEVHLHRPAARYVHLSRIRVLGREYRPWRPLQSEHISLEDHNMFEAYIPALRAATDASLAGSVWDEEGRDLGDLEFRLGAH